MKQVQIDIDLFTDIIKLIVLEQESLRPSVIERLKNKVDRLAAHQRYTEHLNHVQGK